MSLRKALLAATAMALPAAFGNAQAQPVTGPYVGAGVGLNYLHSTDFNINGTLGAALNGAGISRSGEVEFELGVATVFSLGWGFGNGLRAEIEGNYRWNRVDSTSGFAGAGPFSLPRGSQQTYGVMANVLYDFATFAGLPVTPYIGGGIGWAWTHWNSYRATAAASGFRLEAEDTDGNFAYQGIAGLAYNIAAVPGLSLTAEYRFFGTLSPKINVTAAAVPGGAPLGLSGEAETDNFNHSVLLGIRYNFGQARRAPPPAPTAAPPAPAAEAPRTYLVFFDWDRADLTDRARQIIGEAAANSQRVQTTRIEVAGHADRSGAPQYNQRLSQRRAENVAAELVRRGVPRNAIVVTAFGESRPLVPTADGVREPQNRRVEIVLR